MDINASLVRELVAAQFPVWADLPVYPVELDGHDNRTFRLGSTMSVRLPSHERYLAQVDKEQQWLPRLAPRLPLAVPIPLAMGLPSDRYPWRWSVYRWLEGENATTAHIQDLPAFATTLAQFLCALQQTDARDGPLPGQHNFFRGGPLTVYDAETRGAISALHTEIDRNAVTGVWDAALQATWRGRPVWLHGDVSASNLLVNGGRLSAVIDFGCSGVGDPACDLTIAWTFFSGASRQAFRSSLRLDEPTWARARGWALWKALITLVASRDRNRTETRDASRVIDDVIMDHASAA
jgi:aminoglycoside phosphotransferase (APT) family kinase protein